MDHNGFNWVNSIQKLWRWFLTLRSLQVYGVLIFPLSLLFQMWEDGRSQVIVFIDLPFLSLKQEPNKSESPSENMYRNMVKYGNCEVHVDVWIFCG